MITRMACLQSRTRPRRVLLALFPAAPPATRRGRAVLLAGLYRLAGFTDWVNVRAETAITELEQPRKAGTP